MKYENLPCTQCMVCFFQQDLCCVQDHTRSLGNFSDTNKLHFHNLTMQHDQLEIKVLNTFHNYASSLKIIDFLLSSVVLTSSTSILHKNLCSSFKLQCLQAMFFWRHFCMVTHTCFSSLNQSIIFIFNILIEMKLSRLSIRIWHLLEYLVSSHHQFLVH